MTKNSVVKSPPPRREEVLREISQTWRGIKQHMHVRISERVREDGATSLSQCAVLGNICARTDMTVKKIASFLGITSPAATQLVRELEGQELLEKDPKTDDSRSANLLPTAAGTVSLYTISEANGTAVRTADGNAFIVRSESDGRVNSVAKVGDTVAAGATIAQLENSSQRAALIQAEGAYDAAVAAAGGNTTSQATAKQDAVRTWNTATVSVAQVMHTSIDNYFSLSRTAS